MRAEVEVSSGETLANIKLVHGGLELRWDASAFSKANITTADSVFREINSYWASLPADRQSEIWECYTLIHEAINTITDFARLQGSLTLLVKQLYELHPLSDIERHVRLYCNVRYPLNLKEQLDPDEKGDRTYLKSEYMDLVDLSVALRPMVPIWGDYIYRVKNQSGSNYKEYQAMMLLTRSNIMSTKTMLRFVDYIAALCRYNNNSNSASAIIGGLGTSELPEWMLAITVVRRLAVCEVNAVDDKSHLISNVHHFVINNLNGIDRKFEGHVNAKYQETGGADDDNASLAELYKIKQPVSDGDIISITSYCEDLYRIVPVVSKGTVTNEQLEACVKSIQVPSVREMEIRQFHLALAQWVLSSAISPRGVPHLSKPVILNMLAVVQSTLWSWGFYDLACLATASPVEMKDGTHFLGAELGRAKISKALLDRLIEIYPYTSRPSNRDKTPRQTNPGCKAVDIVCSDLCRHDWYIHAPQELVSLSSCGNSSRRMIVPADIKNQLAQLIIKLAERGKSE